METATATQCSLNLPLRSILAASPLDAVGRVQHAAALVHGLKFDAYCAQRLQRDRAHVYRVLNGERQSLPLIKRIAADLGVSASDLMPDQKPTDSLWPA